MPIAAGETDDPPTQHGIAAIDHPIVAVADMEVARRKFERLGFTIPPRGHHLEWGTGNYCIMFPQDYLELRGILDPKRHTAGLDDFLDRNGEALFGLAFSTRNAHKSHDLMIAAGMRPGPVTFLKRVFELPEGWVSPQFSLCIPEERDVLGLLHVVLCEHLTPELIRQPEFLKHANDVRAVRSISRVVDDLDAVEAAQHRFMGDGSVSRKDGKVTLSLPSGQSIRLMVREVFDSAYDDVLKNDAQVTSSPGVVEFAVGAIERTAATLTKNSVPFVQTSEGVLRVGPDECCGVICSFVASPTRCSD